MNTEPQALATLDKARQLLAQASTVDEVRQIRDQAEALRTYSKQRDYSLEMQNYCAEIKLRAERKLGELLAKIEKSKGGIHTHKKSTGGTMPPVLSSYKQALEELDKDKKTAYRWQSIASIPEKKFEEFISEAKEKEEELTSVAAYRLARKLTCPESSNGHSRSSAFDPEAATTMLYQGLSELVDKLWSPKASYKPVIECIQSFVRQLEREEKARK